VADTLKAQFGSGIGRPMLILFVIGFISSFLAVQAAVSRCVWGSARDNALPASRLLDRLGGPERLPIVAIVLTGVVAAIFVLLSGSELYSVLVNFTTIGFYVAFGVPVIGAAIARMRGQWVPGRFSLGRWGKPVTYAASVWIVAQTVNVAWPRNNPDTAWYIDWSMVLTLSGLGILGVAIYAFKRNQIHDPIATRLAPREAPATRPESTRIVA
jgi:amino acid transporter